MTRAKEESNLTIEGNIVDIVNKQIFYGQVVINNGLISDIISNGNETKTEPYILPGFIDSHIHIESSMLLPHNFALAVTKFGTIAAICDPHEIANVLGLEGVKMMIEDGKQSDFYFFNGAPSCVPATCFENSGSCLDSSETESLLQSPDITHLSEMMNYPGVLARDSEVLAKISAAKKHNKPIDGHCPLLSDNDLDDYIANGISTDHECSLLKEAEEKILKGMKILIREGSAAHNFDALIALISRYPDKIMFCSDDKHPDDLLKGHINVLVSNAIKQGYNPMDVLRAACLNPIKHYNLPCGLLQKGDSADFIITDNLIDFNVQSTYIKGKDVVNNPTILSKTVKHLNRFEIDSLQEQDIKVIQSESVIPAIRCFDKQLYTEKILVEAKKNNGETVVDLERDLLKIVVCNRYSPKSKPAVAFINGFGLRKGAIASTVAHDSHNIIAVGTNDKDILKAIGKLIEHKGGISLSVDGTTDLLPLPVAGLISEMPIKQVAENYKRINNKAKELSDKLSAPYMTLSFMALLVIPEIKISDKGLFDVKKFDFIR